MPTIAVAHSRLYLPTKRDAFLFDRIELLNLDLVAPDLDLATLAEIEWLERNGVVVTGSVDLPADANVLSQPDAKQYYMSALVNSLAHAAVEALEVEKDLALVTEERLRNAAAVDADKLECDPDELAVAAYHLFQRAVKHLGQLGLREVEGILKRRIYDDAARAAALCHGASGKVEAVPLLLDATTLDARPAAKGVSLVANVVINRFPIPDELTPWEAIIDFKNNGDARQALLRLRTWMRKAVSDGSTESVLNDELESLLNDYTKYMKQYRIDTRWERFKVFVLWAAGMAEDVIHARIKNALKTLFELRAINAALYKAELAAPAREVAYIAQAHDRFGARTA